MRKSMLKGLLAGLTLSATIIAAHAEVKHKFIAGCFAKGGATIVNKDGEVEKFLKAGKGVQDTWMLKNGNILVSHYTGVKEFTPDGDIAWEFESPNKNIELHSAQPLKNGNILILECGSKKLYEVNRKKKIVHELTLETVAKNRHIQFRSARKTKKGTYWVAFTGEAMAREFNKKGKVIKEIKVEEGNKSIHGLIPLPNGNLLVSTAAKKGIKEFNKKGKVVWELTQKDMKKAGVTKVGYTGGMQRLDNGNTVFAMYGGNPQIVEFTKDKKMVWSYTNWKALKNIAGITIMDKQKKILK